jgi:hypothetical protein
MSRAAPIGSWFPNPRVETRDSSLIMALRLFDWPRTHEKRQLCLRGASTLGLRCALAHEHPAPERSSFPSANGACLYRSFSYLGRARKRRGFVAFSD